MRKLTAILLVPVMLLAFAGVSGAAAVPSTFTDVQNHWAQAQIAQVMEKGIMKGTGHGRFMPDRIMTRAELAVVLKNTFNLDQGDVKFIKAPSVKDYYDDVAEDAWYGDAVMLCAINQIFPYDSRQFSPMAPVTRLEVAQAVSRCFAAKKIPVVTIMMMPMYDDTRDLNAEQMSDIAFVTNTGIMKGYKNKFRPHDYITRAETACVLSATIQVIAQCSEK